MGLYEFTPFSSGTKSVTQALAKGKAKSYLGGGDTIDALKRTGIPLDKFTLFQRAAAQCSNFLKEKLCRE